MQLRQHAAALATLLFLSAAQAQTQALPPAVDAALQAAHIPLDAVGIVVMPTDADTPALSVNAARAMNPASTLKLITTFAALEQFGPAHTFRTEARIAAPPVDGVLQGDLYLKGGGDPKLDVEKFWLLLRQLRARGILDIRGDLALDRTLFAAPADDPAAFDGKPLRAYNVSPDPLLLAYKTLRVTLTSAGGRVRATAEPLLADVTLVNRLHVVAGACVEDWRDRIGLEWRSAVGKGVAGKDKARQLLLGGSYPAACGEKVWNAAVLTHAEFVRAVFAQLWREMGGRFAGAVKDAAAPATAQLAATIESPPLVEIIRDINKHSNNVMARQLLLNLPAQPGTTLADARAALRAWLEAQQMKFPELVIDNGAGLSRTEAVSAEHMAQLLRAAWQSPLMPEFVSSLPVSAEDGTMKKRLGGAPRQMHIKTGTLDQVKTLAGYVQDKTGRRWIVVFFINHPQAQSGRPAQDALLEWVAAGQAGGYMPR